MSVLLSLALLFAPEPAPPEPAPPEPAPGVEEPAQDPVVHPPAPSLEGAGVEPARPPEPDPEAEAPPSPAPEPAPEPRIGELSTEPPPEPDPEPDYELRGDLPYGATAARKSATRRNNDVLVRPFRRPVYSVAAAVRFVTLLSGGADVVQPFGYGFAAQLRIHFLAVVKSRFGVEIHAGHNRVSEREDFQTFEDTTITRITLLTATDFSAGPSMQIPLGPLFLQFGGSAGVALSTLLRPLSADATTDEQISITNFMLRGGLSLGVPILNRHGLTLGSGVQHIFSQREVAIDLAEPDGPTTRPFGTSLEVFAGYQIWF